MDAPPEPHRTAPVTLSVSLAPAGGDGTAQSLALPDHESFVLARELPHPPVHTYLPFWDVYERLIGKPTMARTLLKITPDPKDVDIKLDLGVHGSGDFSATLNGIRLRPDRPSQGVVRRSIPRTVRGFVLELSAIGSPALRVVGVFGEAGIRTLVKTHESVAVLRGSLLELLTPRSLYGKVLAIALRAVAQNPDRTVSRHLDIVDTVRADLETELLLEKSGDHIRHIYAHVFPWMRTRNGAEARVKVSPPPRDSWIPALRALNLERVALDADDPIRGPREMLYRNPGTIDDLVFLADRLDENGVLSIDDLVHQLDTP